MRHHRLTIALGLALLLITAVPAFAEHHETIDPFAADWQWGIADASGKLSQLAEAIPADKYSWKPNDEVRSVSEVFMHVVGANYFIGRALGLEVPEGITQDMEKTVTSKEEVMKHLEASFAHLGTTDLSAENFDDQIPFFGGQNWSRRRILFLLMAHAHEHLGQSIAYTRSMGIAPPWSN